MREGPSSREKKCCWDESVKGVPFCYQSAFWARNGIRKGFWVEPLPKECPTEPKSRVNCGFSRITPDQCQSLGKYSFLKSLNALKMTSK